MARPATERVKPPFGRRMRRPASNACWDGGEACLPHTKFRCSPRAQQPDGFVALKDVKEMAQCLAAFRRERWIARQHQGGIVARRADELGMRTDPGNAKPRHSRLPRTQDVSFPPQLEILLRDAKAVLCFAHDAKARL